MSCPNPIYNKNRKWHTTSIDESGRLNNTRAAWILCINIFSHDPLRCFTFRFLKTEAHTRDGVAKMAWAIFCITNPTDPSRRGPKLMCCTPRRGLVWVTLFSCVSTSKRLNQFIWPACFVSSDATLWALNRIKRHSDITKSTTDIITCILSQYEKNRP